eukprot:TRINITY_DN30536_c0_g1_i1.p1 TRINITY_DN30536_c0_g1~~TRINITY_DN30536_c0_g1_i1.p1  ORF type:complete len:281 (+),score=55.58 TRINITY_DN30536_c0_g1_i1:222-1064(+)
MNNQELPEESMRRMMTVVPGLLIAGWGQVCTAGSKPALEMLWDLVEESGSAEPIPITAHTRARVSTKFRAALQELQGVDQIALAALPEKPREVAGLRGVEKMLTDAANAPNQMNAALASAIAQRSVIDAAPVLGQCQQEPATLNSALTELDPALVAKARLLQKRRQADRDAGHESAMQAVSKMSRLLTICPIVRTLFRSKKKRALPLREVVKHVVQTQSVTSTDGEVEELLRQMAELVPNWCGVKRHQHSGEYMNLDRNADFAAVLAVVRNMHYQSEIDQ